MISGLVAFQHASRPEAKQAFDVLSHFETMPKSPGDNLELLRARVVTALDVHGIGHAGEVIQRREIKQAFAEITQTEKILAENKRGRASYSWNNVKEKREALVQALYLCRKAPKRPLEDEPAGGGFPVKKQPEVVLDLTGDDNEEDDAELKQALENSLVDN